MPTARDAQLRLRELGDPADAQFLQRFFKTGPGQYGEGDQFLGIRAPVLRKVGDKFAELSLDALDELLQSPMHEARLLTLYVMVLQYARGDARHRRKVYQLYLRRRKFVNNWDLVDSSAPYIVGPHLAGRDISPLLKLAKSRVLWDRRIAILATLHFIRLGQTEPTLELAELLLQDPHDLMHKAVGWMVREVGKRDASAFRSFLDRHAPQMPRTMLRYAIERFDAAERKAYLHRRRC